MPVTANEIARIVGVSAATVSMVLNNRPGVGEETRKKILSLAKELGYEKQQRPNQGPLKSLTLVIYKKHGDVVSDTPFFAELIQGIEMETRKDDFSLVISYFYESYNSRQQLSAISSSSSRGVILLATEMVSTDIARFMPLQIPTVILDNTFDDVDLDSITINNIQGSMQAVKYFERMGHKKIGHLRSSVGINNFFERRDGYLKAMNNQIDPKHTVSISSTSDGAYEDMKKYLLSAPEIPTAYFADNDIIAISCIRALREAGYQVPNDVSVIGFDDVPASSLIDPPLSTMQVPKKNLGILAVERLLKRINGDKSESIRIAVNTSLVTRGSVRQLVSKPARIQPGSAGFV
jgi:LacI family transcriptional regulator